jgi:hypothetical protein
MKNCPGGNGEAEIKAQVIQNCNSRCRTQEAIESDNVVHVEYWSEVIEGGCIGNY